MVIAPPWTHGGGGGEGGLSKLPGEILGLIISWTPVSPSGWRGEGWGDALAWGLGVDEFLSLVLLLLLLFVEVVVVVVLLLFVAAALVIGINNNDNNITIIVVVIIDDIFSIA